MVVLVGAIISPHDNEAHSAFDAIQNRKNVSETPRNNGSRNHPAS